MSPAIDSREKMRKKSDRRCTCSHGSMQGMNPATRLDSSFVHISHDQHSTGENLDEYASFPTEAMGVDLLPEFSDRGLIMSERYIAALVEAASQRLMDGLDVPLCRSCTERVARAVDVDTERLLAEAKMYDEMVDAEEDKRRGVEKVLAISAGLERDEADSHEDPPPLDGDRLIRDAIASFQEEAEILRGAYAEHERELYFLSEQLSYQAQRGMELREAEEVLYRDINDIEVDAKEFESIRNRLSSRCSNAQREVAKLSRVRLQSTLFDVAVNGPRYPLINELRLGFRPKGSLGWDEINAAWAQAAQLLMFVGGAVRFSSHDMRVVPLTSCAKIIGVGSSGSRKVVHNLGRDMDGSCHGRGSAVDGDDNDPRRLSDRSTGMARALCAFNALLYQLVCHIREHCPGAAGSRAPYPMSRFVVGPHDLLQLQKNDDAGWSAAIMCIASNLQWLSQMSFSEDEK